MVRSKGQFLKGTGPLILGVHDNSADLKFVYVMPETGTDRAPCMGLPVTARLAHQ
jgi:hypothetical protein